MPDDSKLFAKAPSLTKGQTKFGADFFKNDPIALKTLVKVAGRGRKALVAIRKRFPKLIPVLPVPADDRLTASDVLRVADFVVGVIREKGMLRIAAPSRESAITGNEKPVVIRANQTMKKGGIWSWLLIL